MTSFCYFGLVRQYKMVSLSFQAKIPTESAFGIKVLISFGDFQTWNLGSNGSCALVSWDSEGYFYSPNYYFMTVIYFVLSTVYTPKLAIVWGVESPCCCVLFQRQILLFYGWRHFAARKKCSLLKRVLHMKCNLDKYSKLIGLYFSLDF